MTEVESKDEEKDRSSKNANYQELLSSLQSISESESSSEVGSDFGTSPAEFGTIKTKEWWDKLQRQLQREAERQILDGDEKDGSPKSNPQNGSVRHKKNRIKRASWLESKEKIMAQMLEETSKEESSFAGYSVPSSSSESSEPTASKLDAKNGSWWDNLKEDLEKEQGVEGKENTAISVSGSMEEVKVSQSGNWWADIKEDLDKEQGITNPQRSSLTSSLATSSTDWWGQLTNELDSENGEPPIPDKDNKRNSMFSPEHSKAAQERSRSRAQSMSAAFGRPEEDSGGNGTMLRIYNGVYRGETIVGTDNNAVAHGVGTFTSSNGELYVGQWNQGKRQGKGLRTWKDGKEYIGNWENNKRTGNGLMSWPNGDVYIGETQYGFQQGHGMMIYANGDKYIGDWAVSERHGRGIIYFKNGDTYFGDWIRNKREGHGVLKTTDGKTKDGMWKDNKYVGSKRLSFFGK